VTNESGRQQLEGENGYVIKFILFCFRVKEIVYFRATEQRSTTPDVNSISDEVDEVQPADVGRDEPAKYAANDF